jgi:alpha-L-arabinofuranosidase
MMKPMKTYLSRTLLGLLVLTGMLCQPGISAEIPDTVELSIQTGQTQEPISEYIYGQFIEHLGRCIYEGIWAEMLHDRKFYYPVTDEYHPWTTTTDTSFWGGGEFPTLKASPWKVIGPENTVTMDQQHPYSGEQSPVIHVPQNTTAGIEQRELGLLDGMKYNGRIVLAGDASAAPIQITLIWGDAPNDRQTVTLKKISDAFKKYTFAFKAKANTDDGRLQITSAGTGAFTIGAVSLMPADNIKGFRRDTLALLKELDAPVYRWPGGNFVSDYDWRDGIGDMDKRPTRKNPAWTGIEPNDVGIHEFMTLCELIDTEPFIAMNTGLGTVEMAAEEVEYCNGSIETPMGKWRAENGQKKPFNVKWWAVGNEMYGNWQLGHMPLEDYVKKHIACVNAVRKIDPTVQLIGVGAIGKWSETMMTQCSDHMELISEHIYRKESKNLVEHSRLIANAIKEVADAHRRYRKDIPGLAEKDIRIAMDEWNYWYGNYRYGELGVRYYLQDALGIAAGLHEYFRNSDLFFMANYAQTVNVIGAIKTNKTDAKFATTGLVLKMYHDRFGEIPVQISEVALPLDIHAALSADQKTLTIGVVNPTNDPCTLQLTAEDAKLGKNAKLFFITGTDKMAYNEPGKDMNVTIQEQTLRNHDNQLPVHPLSVSIYQIPVR